MSDYTAVLLDIEGTTTPLSYSRDTLAPYARERLKDFVLNFASEAQIAGAERDREMDARRNQNPPGDFDADPRQATADYLLWQMDRDRKSTTLREIQNEIWAEGYEAGDLHGEMFDDVAPRLKQWKKQGKPVYIFSSGSVASQKKFFSSVNGDDLTRYIAGYFDTTTGPKKEPGSFLDIAKAIHRDPDVILFVSDANVELDAAQKAGLQTRHSRRTGNKEMGSSHRAVGSFAELE